MKRYVLYVVAILICLGMMGCGAEKAPSTKTAVSGSDISDSQQPAPFVTIYQISSEVFSEFLDLRSSSVMRDSESYTYPGDLDYYPTWNVTIKDIDSELIEFVSNGLGMYLQEHGIDGAIVEYAVFEAPYVPLTVWAKTADAEGFVTIDEHPMDPDHTYRFHTSSAYEKRFAYREAQVYVLGQPLQTDAMVEMNEEYAVVPLMAVLKACGATVNKMTDEEFSIEFLHQTYTLNLRERTLYKNGDTLDMFLTTGLTTLYEENGDMMVCGTILNNVLKDMGRPVGVNCDTTHNTVEIVERE